MQQWSLDHPVWHAILRVICWVLPLLMVMPAMIWWERRLLAWMQDRIGPNRVGNITFSKTSSFVPGFLKGRKFGLQGILQPIADGIKLIMKEEIVPTGVDRLIYVIAPAITLFPVLALGGTLPWGPQEGFYKFLTPIADMNIGVVYMLAVSSLGVYGVVLAGYSADNKYSLLGGLRSSAQLISYELAMGMSLACVVLATGSLKVTAIVAAQEQPLWGGAKYIQNWNAFTPFGFVAMLIFGICMIAETNRPPFDLPEAENELVAGYHTEYSSMKFASFFMGEYIAMFVFGGVLSCAFLGGYNALPIRWDVLGADVPSLAGICSFMSRANYWLAPIFFVGKGFAVVTGYIWLRATMPRLRYDQLMFLGWKSLLPTAVANFIVVAIWIVCTRLYGPAGGFAAAGGAIVLSIVLYLNLMSLGRGRGDSLGSRQITMIDAAPAVRSVHMVDPTASTN